MRECYDWLNGWMEGGKKGETGSGWLYGSNGWIGNNTARNGWTGQHRTGQDRTGQDGLEGQLGKSWKQDNRGKTRRTEGKGLEEALEPNGWKDGDLLLPLPLTVTSYTCYLSLTSYTC